MPRVYTKKASQRRYTRSDKRIPEGVSLGDKKPNYRCTWIGCSEDILPGEEYHTWSFRYGGTKRIHARHGRPKPSMLTQSKMSTVYEAQENTDLSGLESEEDISAALQELAEAVEEVAQEYEQAAEPFGGQGENAERAEELRSWTSDLESWSPDRSEPEYCDAHEDQSDLTPVGEVEAEDCEECAEKRDEWLEAMRDSAQEIIDGCPL